MWVVVVTFSARSFSGLRWRGPRRDFTAGIAAAMVAAPCRSRVFALDMPTTSIRFGQDVDLRSLPAAGWDFPPSWVVDRTGSDQRAPFGPDTRRVQDRCRPVEFANAPEQVEHLTLQSLEHPSRTEALNRRCAVGAHPNDGGRCRPEDPLVSTYTIPVNTARSAVGTLPPPSGRAAKSGING